MSLIPSAIHTQIEAQRIRLRTEETPGTNIVLPME